MMKKTNPACFIASRLASVRTSGRNRIMMRVAVTGVAVSIAVMIVALSVIFGFKEQISSKVTGFSSELQVLHLDNNNSFETVPIAARQPFLKDFDRMPGIANYYTYAQKAGVLRGEEAMQGIVLKGVDSLYDWKFFRDNLVSGNIPDIRRPEKSKDVLISQSLARKINLKPGDKFEIMFIQDRVRRDRFAVAGIYNTSLAEFDDIMVMTDIRNIQRLNNWGDSLVSGVGIGLRDIARLDEMHERVEETIFSYAEDDTNQSLMVTDVKEKNGAIFDWLQLQDVNMAVIITIMIIVAAFNMICITLIILLEKSSMIGVLKTLGMRDSVLQRLFLFRLSYILVRGLAIGDITGLALVLLQQYTGFVKLPEAEYLLAQVPVSVHWEFILLVNAGSFVVILLLQTIPTLIISRIQPHTTLKIS